MKIYALRDVKVGFLTPTVAENDSIAVRQLENVLRQGSGTLFDTHPEDFSLYCLGEYDSQTGSITPVMPVCICEAVSLLV